MTDFVRAMRVGTVSRFVKKIQIVLAGKSASTAVAGPVVQREQNVQKDRYALKESAFQDVTMIKIVEMI